jgi:hypothetical protein
VRAYQHGTDAGAPRDDLAADLLAAMRWTTRALQPATARTT